MLRFPGKPPQKPPSLLDWFNRLNEDHFNGGLIQVEIDWNTRLTSSAGRFLVEGRSKNQSKRSQNWIEKILWPNQKKISSQNSFSKNPRIEIAHYLLEKENWADLIYDTLAHEMIHYWLWSQNKPFGHTPEFHQKMNQMGVSRYNHTPKRPGLKYEYECPGCNQRFPSRKRLRGRACAQCCQKFSKGRYDAQFQLRLVDSPGLRRRHNDEHSKGNERSGSQTRSN